METIAGQFWAAGAPTAGANTMLPIQVDALGRIITVAAESLGSITWAAPVAVGMTGVSKTFVPADTARRILLMWSPSTNAAAGFDIAGGTVVLATALQLVPGASPVVFSGADTPTGIVTAIGTNTQNIYYQSGS